MSPPRSHRRDLACHWASRSHLPRSRRSPRAVPTSLPALARNPPSSVVRTAVIVARFSVIRHTHSIAGGGMDTRRTRGLIRDEGRLRSALVEHEKRRFDVDTAQAVRYRVEDLLETVGLIAQDTDFWARLSDINRPPSSQQLERLRQLDPLAFA